MLADGHSVDTTMGLTPTAGLVMASRCGDLDPAVPLWLVQHAGLAAAHSCSAAGGTISNRRSNPIIRSG